MSVRRLAEDSVQPSGFAFAGDNVGWAERTIRKYPEGRQQSAVIPLLMRAQDQDGWVTKAAIEHIATMLKMPLIRVLEVATFYTQFQLKPVGTRAHIQVCGTTPCMLRGSDALKDVCRSRIHQEQFHLNETGTLSWEEVECLGACVNAPMVMVFKDTFEDLTPETLEDLIDAMERGDVVKAGPQIDRQLSAPFGGPTTLIDGEAGEPRDVPVFEPTVEAQDVGGSVPPSNAGRPDTAAPETNPSVSAAGKAVNGNVDQAVEHRNPVDPDSGSGPGAGATGGVQKGPTGAGDKESGLENAGSASADADVTRRDGRLGVQGEKDERAVVASDRFAEPPEGSHKPAPASDQSEEISTGGPLEGKRVSDDVIAALPVLVDNMPPVGTGSETIEGVPGVTVTSAGAVDADGRKIVGEKPQGLMTSADGEKDDLKAIKGIGPIIETKLNDLGIFHFRQIAAWTTKELVWIDDYLNFRGRAVRENWMSQAADLDAKRLETM